MYAVGDLAGLRTLAGGILKNSYRHLYIADIITTALVLCLCPASGVQRWQLR